MSGLSLLHVVTVKEVVINVDMRTILRTIFISGKIKKSVIKIDIRVKLQAKFTFKLPHSLT